LVHLALNRTPMGATVRLPLLSPAEPRQAFRLVSTKALSSWRVRAINSLTGYSGIKPFTRTYLHSLSHRK